MAALHRSGHGWCLQRDYGPRRNRRPGRHPMRGDVSLENNGGFIQIAIDLSPDGGVVDASAWSGIELDVFGNGEEYGVHLRTDAMTRPWQSYRQIFTAYAEWRTVQLPFDNLFPIALMFYSILIGCCALAW